ncbi:hypothetical protein J2R98_000161 [Alkalibacillus filiformis]|uniref:Uncharacterized protein n=1 Tax=Alkalibacillus filiformis TaxID=200990 RepID=A0ABU0DPI0_9BACI|nr:hypothetical protein [Alkalibacillus filiformis]MDQ0350358.1 hypothetical protein [Alkalibacillus filiformis]
MQCIICKNEKSVDDICMYSINYMTKGRVQKRYYCKKCSVKKYGDNWRQIKGYDEHYEVSESGYVSVYRQDKYFDITHIKNASTRYVYLYKNGKKIKKNIYSLINKFFRDN